MQYACFQNYSQTTIIFIISVSSDPGSYELEMKIANKKITNKKKLYFIISKEYSML